MEQKKELTMRVPSEANFSLTKVKIIKDGGLDVHYKVSETVNNETYTNKYHVESAKDIHPDLRELFKNLRPILGRVFNLTSFLSLVEAKDYKASSAQIDKARDFADGCLENIEVRGISLSGENDNNGCVLTGLFTVGNGQKTAINSPRMKFSSDTYGFEEDLADIVTEIEEEVYAFLFKGKKAELSLFGDDGTPTPEASCDRDLFEESEGSGEEDNFPAE